MSAATVARNYSFQWGYVTYTERGKAKLTVEGSVTLAVQQEPSAPDLAHSEVCELVFASGPLAVKRPWRAEIGERGATRSKAKPVMDGTGIRDEITRNGYLVASTPKGGTVAV